MIQLKINNKSGHLATDWNDMTVQQAINLMDIPIPDRITDISDPAQWLSYGVDYAAKVFTVLSDFDRSVVDKTQAADIVTYFNQYLIGFVIDLHSQSPESYRPTGIKSFRLKGIDYLLPTSLKVESKILPMYSASAVEFVESSNVLSMIADLKSEGIKYLPLLIATYCRPAGEAFNEKTVTDRTELFKTLPMSTAWELFFCIQALIQSYTINILRFTQRQMKSQLMRLRLQVWIAGVIRPGFIRSLSRRLKGA